MEPENRKEVSLALAAISSLMPVATAFVEKSALAFGLEEKGALLLTLSTEEIFLHLCQTTPDQKVEIRCAGGGYYVQVEFEIPIEDLNLKAFNLTARINPEDERLLEDLGLVLASRSVDRFRIWEEKGRGLHLVLIKEKEYPAAPDTAPFQVQPLSTFSLRTPDREELKDFAQLASFYYPSYVLPPFFRFPGKMADMAEAGAFKAVIAVDPKGHMGGGMLWYWRGLKIMACSGPYLFNQPQESPMAEALMEALLQDIARTRAVGLLSRYPTRDLPLNFFEPLGSFSFFPSKGAPLWITAYYRHLHEDAGSMVWSHSEMAPFLKQEFERMILPRDLRELKDFGERRNPYSVLSAKFDRDRNLVTLYPLRPGSDEEQNVANHLTLLRKEGWRNIFFEMDLAKSQQVEFAPALIKNNVLPCLLLPYAGEGDVVLFQAAGF